MTQADNQPDAREGIATASIILTPPTPLHHSNKRAQVVVVLVIVLAAVLLFLPGTNPESEFLGSTSSDGITQSNVNPKDAAFEKAPPLSDAEALVFRRQAQDLLVEIVELKNSLLEQNVIAWAADDFASIELDLASAESQYQVGEYEQAEQAYSNVRSELSVLLESFQPRLDGLLIEAGAAIADYRAADAQQFYESALAMDITNSRAQNGIALATVLPQIQQVLTEAINCRSRQDLNCALEYTEQALALNADFTPARELNDALSIELIQNSYQAKMSQGFLALDQQRWESARSAFGDAENILPGQNNTELALAQTGAAQELVEVTQLLDKARGLEAQEQWDRAQKIYEKLLRRDGSLVEPNVRLVAVKARAKIAAKYRRFIADPMILSSTREALEAEQLLRDTATLTAKSPVLAEQHQLLTKHLSIMKTPKDIAFTSDGETQVTVFKVAKLGKFNQTTLTLMPGKYIASGNRQGYRDIRVEFIVSGDSAIPPIAIACLDLI